MLDHCKEEECCFESGGDDWVWMVVVLWVACFVLLRAADDEDGPEGVDAAVTVGPAGAVDSLPVLVVGPGVEFFLVPKSEDVVEPAPMEERRELALLLVPNFRVDDIAMFLYI